MTKIKETSLIFQTIGISPAEQAVYLTLLEAQVTSIRQIAALTGINRGKIYDSLKRLIALGLVSFKRRGKQRRFVAESPERIKDLLAEKHQELVQANELADQLIPSLLANTKRRAGEPIVRFYEDDDGVAAILRDVLRTVVKNNPKEYCVYSSKPLRTYLYRRFPNFTRQRIKDGIFVRVIAIGEGGEPVELAERKWLLGHSNEVSSSYVLIYGTKVAMISLSPNHTPYGVVIDEAGLANTQRLLFERLWQSL